MRAARGTAEQVERRPPADGNQRVRSSGEESLYSLDFVNRWNKLIHPLFMAKVAILASNLL